MDKHSHMKPQIEHIPFACLCLVLIMMNSAGPRQPLSVPTHKNLFTSWTTEAKKEQPAGQPHTGFSREKRTRFGLWMQFT